jgi:hypothetical protein
MRCATLFRSRSIQEMSQSRANEQPSPQQDSQGRIQRIRNSILAFCKSCEGHKGIKEHLEWNCSDVGGFAGSGMEGLQKTLKVTYQVQVPPKDRSALHGHVTRACYSTRLLYPDAETDGFPLRYGIKKVPLATKMEPKGYQTNRYTFE